MYIHSNFNLDIEYYEFKASKKLNQLNKNNEELKKIYFKCKKTLEYIKNIEEFLIKKEKEKEEKKEKDESNKNKISDNNLEKDINIINNEEKKEEYDDETNQKKEEDDIKKIEKDFLNHKSFIKEKKYVRIIRYKYY